MLCLSATLPARKTSVEWSLPKLFPTPISERAVSPSDEPISFKCRVVDFRANYVQEEMIKPEYEIRVFYGGLTRFRSIGLIFSPGSPVTAESMGLRAGDALKKLGIDLPYIKRVPELERDAQKFRMILPPSTVVFTNSALVWEYLGFKNFYSFQQGSIIKDGHGIAYGFTNSTMDDMVVESSHNMPVRSSILELLAHRGIVPDPDGVLDIIVGFRFLDRIFRAGLSQDQEISTEKVHHNMQRIIATIRNYSNLAEIPLKTSIVTNTAISLRSKKAQIPMPGVEILIEPRLAGVAARRFTHSLSSRMYFNLSNTADYLISWYKRPKDPLEVCYPLYLVVNGRPGNMMVQFENGGSSRGQTGLMGVVRAANDVRESSFFIDSSAASLKSVLVSPKMSTLFLPEDIEVYIDVLLLHRAGKNQQPNTNKLPFQKSSLKIDGTGAGGPTSDITSSSTAQAYDDDDDDDDEDISDQERAS